MLIIDNNIIQTTDISEIIEKAYNEINEQSKNTFRVQVLENLSKMISNEIISKNDLEMITESLNKFFSLLSHIAKAQYFAKNMHYVFSNCKL